MHKSLASLPLFECCCQQTRQTLQRNYGRALKQPRHHLFKHTCDCGHPIPVYLPGDHNNDFGGLSCSVLLYNKHQINGHLSITLPPPICLCFPQFPSVLPKLNGFLFPLEVYDIHTSMSFDHIHPFQFCPYPPSIFPPTSCSPFLILMSRFSAAGLYMDGQPSTGV